MDDLRGMIAVVTGASRGIDILVNNPGIERIRRFEDAAEHRG